MSLRFYHVDARLIDCKINNKDSSFYLSFVYGHQIRKLRYMLWETLERIASNRKGPWIMYGDFNKILKRNEKKGGRPREAWSFLNFRNMVNTCNVFDLPFKENNMTWLGQRRKHTRECWLDR